MDDIRSTNSPGGSISAGDRESNLTDPERGRLLLEQLRAGYAPSTVEADELQNSITQARSYQNVLEAEISSLDQELLPLLNRLATKKAKRDTVTKDISIQSALLSPVRRLPRELLLEVFDEACPENCMPIPKSIDECPSLVLSHTCHSWRELALYSPKLWSRITIDLTLIESDDPPLKKPYLVEMYLRLSKDHPLDITILNVDESEWVEVDDIVERDKRTLSLIADNAWRWCSLDCYEKVFPAIPEPYGNFSLLCDVTITYDRQVADDDDDDPREEPIWLTRARNIEDLTMDSPSYPLISVSWDNVKILTLNGDTNDPCNENTSSTIHSFLSHLSLESPNLEEFNWFIATNDKSFINPSTFDRLNCLRVGGDVNLNWIIAPNLQHLDVSEIRGERWTSEIVTRFIQTSGANLTSIAIGAEYMQYEQFSSSFKSMENLAHLICTNVSQSNLCPLFVSLTALSSPDAAENMLLPHLRTVTLYWDSILENFYATDFASPTKEAVVVIDKLIMEFLEFRRSQRPLSFERFSVLTSRDLEESRLLFKCQKPFYKDRLRQLRSGGLSLCFNGDWSPIEGLACVDEE